jgi:integrase
LAAIPLFFRGQSGKGIAKMNPFEGLKVPIKRKAIQERDIFNADDLKKIFNNPAFADFEGREPWKYWVPLIGLYSGARVGEIAQLRKQDVFQDGGDMVFRITDEAGSVKNISSERVVPVHPELILKGFNDFCIGAFSEDRERLFPELYEVDIKPGDKVSRWFNTTYLKNFGLKPTDRKISFHSIRHNFINEFRKMNAPEVKVKQLTGHSHESITYGRYGGEYGLQGLYDLIKLVKYDI